VISLQNVQELLVGVRVIGVASFDFVQVLNGMIKFSRGLLLGGDVLVVEVVEVGGCSRGLGVRRPGRVYGVDERLLPVRMRVPMGCHRPRTGTDHDILDKRCSDREDAWVDGCWCGHWYRWQHRRIPHRPRNDAILVCTLCRSSEGRRYCDSIGVERVRRDFYTVALGEECIETLDEVRIAVKQTRDALDYTWCVDSVGCGRRYQQPKAQASGAHNKRLCTVATHTWLLKSFMMSRNWLYTSGLSWNWFLTASR